MHAVTEPSPLRTGTTLTLDRPSGPAVATIDQVVQRNWSRTGRATVDGESQLFVKQFVGRDGRWHARVCADEATGAERAVAHVSAFDVVPVVARNEARLVLAYPEHEVDTPDELLRNEPERFSRAWPSLRDHLGGLLVDLASAAARATDLPVKVRPYASRGDALVFKGLDVRNLGVPRHGGKAVLFDVGRPYLGPVEEAAAKLFVSVAMLSWGRPIHRFVAGPPFDLIDDVRADLASWLLRDAVRRQLRTDVHGRRLWPAGRTRVERTGRRAVIESVGRVYVHRLEDWFDRHGL